MPGISNASNTTLSQTQVMLKKLKKYPKHQNYPEIRKENLRRKHCRRSMSKKKHKLENGSISKEKILCEISRLSNNRKKGSRKRKKRSCHILLKFIKKCISMRLSKTRSLKFLNSKGMITAGSEKERKGLRTSKRQSKYTKSYRERRRKNQSQKLKKKILKRQ